MLILLEWTLTSRRSTGAHTTVPCMKRRVVWATSMLLIQILWCATFY